MRFFDIHGNEATINPASFFWENNNMAPFWIVHIDTHMKYFTVANIKKIIDAMALARANQLEISIASDSGFRLELNDMTISTNGTTYDLSVCLGGVENATKWWSQNDMDEIISYANMYGIDIVPTFSVPGHMGKILARFSQFKYQNTTALNIKDESAVNFGLAILEKYATYFSNKGCKRFNINYDEIMGFGVGYPAIYNNGDFQYFVDFANKAAKLLKSICVVPRAFNELFDYNNDSDYYVSRDFEVLYWDGTIPNENLATAQQLIGLGYTVINSSQVYYWVNNSQRQVTAETLRTADFLKDFDTTPSTKNGAGAMFCIWCDNAQSSPDAGDGGDAIVNAVLPLISAYGEGIQHTLSITN